MITELRLVEAKSEDLQAYRKKVAAILKENGRADDAAVKDLMAKLDQVRLQLVDQITQIQGDGGTFQSAQLRALRDAIQSATSELSRRLGQTLEDTLQSGWTSGGAKMDDLLALVGVPTHELPLQVSGDQLLIARQVAADLVSRVSTDFRQKASRVIQMSILGQTPSFTAMQQVAGLLRTQPSRSDPSLGTIAYQAERIVRTEAGGIFSLASQIRQQQVADSTTGLKKSWVTAHDDRVRPDHVSAGNRYAPGGDPGPIPFTQKYLVGDEHLAFPHDPSASARQRVNCRCISVLHKDEWFSSDGGQS